MTEEAGKSTPDEAGGAVLLFSEDGELYVRGSVDDVDLLCRRLGRSAPAGRRASGVAAAASGVAVAASGAAALASHGDVFRLTAQAAELARSHGLVVDDGVVRSFVRGEGGRFAGQLTFESVQLGAEQALALQSAAVALALRTAIANVQATVDRIEAKVGGLQDLLAAQQVGDVVGAYRMLDRVVTETVARGRLLEADWDAVAPAGLLLSRDIERLRAFVHKRLDAVDAAARLPRRQAQVEALGQPGAVIDALELLQLGEQALHLWEYLRVERTRRVEPDQLESALQDGRRSLLLHRELDRALVEEAVAAVEAARVIHPLEWPRFLSAQTMETASNQVLEAVAAFAAATRAPEVVFARELRRPDFADAGEEARRRAAGA